MTIHMKREQRGNKKTLFDVTMTSFLLVFLFLVFCFGEREKRNERVRRRKETNATADEPGRAGVDPDGVF